MRIIFRTDNQTVQNTKNCHKKTSRFFRIILVAVLCFSLLSVLGSFIGDGGLAIIYQQSRIKKELRARVAEQEQRKQKLLTRVEALKNDPLALERVAREELGLVKENEIIFDFRTSGLD